ncbi:MAG TPA: LacI family DNA-binding transcriptional regulator [bacterium]|nr:LacI family DNA-binding transcriptional regulator [bacterium]HPR87557.1 LacI family DNA-binding transcriptional regulator [bacterium]
MNVTIREVAREAGVAVSTVSLVLNRKGRVSRETERKVLEAIEKLHYHPQRSARGLVTRHSGNLGFILSSDHFSNAEPFYTKIFLGTEFEARSHDYYVLLTTIGEQFQEKEIPRFLLEKNVDGVILAGTVPARIIEYIKERGLPCVLIDYLPPSGNYSAILIDNADGIRQAVTHLIEKGHRDLVFVGGDSQHPGMRERRDAFCRTMAEHGLAADAGRICAEALLSGAQEGFDAALQVITNKVKVTAFVAANDALASGILRACRDHKLRIPEDVAITGFDDVETAITARPTLTTLHVPKEEMGALAVRLLSQIIAGTASAGTKILVPVRLVCREST